MPLTLRSALPYLRRSYCAVWSSMMEHRWQSLVQLVTCVLALCLTGATIAQSSYPDRPVHLLVLYPPGALTDLLVLTREP
jgi:hypothetical protein